MKYAAKFKEKYDMGMRERRYFVQIKGEFDQETYLKLKELLK